MAERQLNATLKCRQTDGGEEFLSKAQEAYMQAEGIEHQTSMPRTAQQNSHAEWFQQTIVSEAEVMRHQTNLSDGFWTYAGRAKMIIYNITLIKRANYKTLKELWDKKKLNGSHLRVLVCSAHVHVHEEK